MKQPAEIANWLVEWQASLPSSAKVFIGNYTYLDGDLHVKLALCADYCISRLRQARPSTGVAFLCTPTDIHVRTDASDSASRANYGLGLGSFGLEKLANLLSGGKFLVKVRMRLRSPFGHLQREFPCMVAPALYIWWCGRPWQRVFHIWLRQPSIYGGVAGHGSALAEEFPKMVAPAEGRTEP